MRRCITGHNIQLFFPLQQLHRQGMLLRMFNANSGIQCGRAHLSLAEQALHPGVCILQIRRSIAFKAQHGIPVEYIIGGTVFT